MFKQKLLQLYIMASTGGALLQLSAHGTGPIMRDSYSSASRYETDPRAYSTYQHYQHYQPFDATPRTYIRSHRVHMRIL
jgi:hypothetical protein